MPQSSNARSRTKLGASASVFDPAFLPQGDDDLTTSADSSSAYAGAYARPRIPARALDTHTINLAPDIGGAYSPSLPNTPDFTRTVTPGLQDAYAEVAHNKGISSAYGPDSVYSPNSSDIRANAGSPNIIRDVYAPQLSDIGSRLESAYAAPHAGTVRQVLGAVIGRRNPQLGGLVSGELQREQRIAPLEHQYQLVSSIIQANRAMQAQDILNAKNLSDVYKNRFITTRGGGAVFDIGTQAMVPGTAPPLKPQEAAVQDYMGRVNPDTGKNYTPAEALQQVNQDTQDTKPGHLTHTSPFEAFAYGDPEEKKAAQDFLSFEKRMGAQYQRPTDAEFRYSLYQRDPDGYKAVFGDRGQTAGDRAHATRMLQFFQKQRDSIQKDFMLGDDEKAQKLQEIDQLQQPFMDAAGLGGAGNSGGDRVNVIHPNGTRGTIPRSQLPAAKRKGYRVAQ